MNATGIDLYWLPLGAGGHFVAFNGRVYEFFQALREHRASRDLYHTALEVTVPEARYVIENAWPIPDRHPEQRGVTVQGPVGLPLLGHLQVFRYEVRCWPGGAIADIADAVASPQRVSNDGSQARLLLKLVDAVPALVWGRDRSHLGEMWNSNSVISWLLTRVGIPMAAIHAPSGGRAPGWRAGVIIAERMNHNERRRHEFASRSRTVLTH